MPNLKGCSRPGGSFKWSRQLRQSQALVEPLQGVQNLLETSFGNRRQRTKNLGAICFAVERDHGCGKSAEDVVVVYGVHYVGSWHCTLIRYVGAAAGQCAPQETCIQR